MHRACIASRELLIKMRLYLRHEQLVAAALQLQLALVKLLTHLAVMYDRKIEVVYKYLHSRYLVCVTRDCVGILEPSVAVLTASETLT